MGNINEFCKCEQKDNSLLEYNLTSSQNLPEANKETIIDEIVNYQSEKNNVTPQKMNNDNTSQNIKITPDRTTVKMIQQWINDYCDAGLEVDGIFGPKSKNGIVKALQHCHNIDFGKDLVEDGKWGPKTSNACQYVSSSHNKNSNLAFIAQCLLYINGYDPKGLDSIFGNNSTKAAKLFQSEHNLESDGAVGKLTFVKLVA